MSVRTQSSFVRFLFMRGLCNEYFRFRCFIFMKNPFFTSCEHRLVADRLESLRSQEPRSTPEVPYEEILARTKDSFRRGRESLQAGRYQEADKVLTEAIVSNPADASLFYLRAVVRFFLKDSEKDPMADVMEGTQLELREDPNGFTKYFGDLFENIQGKGRLWLEDQRLRAKSYLARTKNEDTTEMTNEDFVPSPEEFREASLSLENDLSMHLERHEKNTRINIKGLSRDPAIVLNYRKVDPEWIKEYFASRPGFFDGKEGHHRMIAWKILVARTLRIEGCVRGCVQKTNVQNTLLKIEAHRESPLGDLNILSGDVLYVAGSETFEDFKKERPQDSAAIDSYQKKYGQHGYRFGMKPIQNAFLHLVGKHIASFQCVRPEKAMEDVKNKKQKMDILRMIGAKRKLPLSLVLDGHASKDRFYFHRPRVGVMGTVDATSEDHSISVRELVDAFVKRFQETRCLPVGLINSEYGQEAVDTHFGLDFFTDVVPLDKGGVKLRELVIADQKRVGRNNFVLFVPGMFSPANYMKEGDVPYKMVDRIIFMQCEGMDFAVSFYRELQRRLGGKEYYLPITRREEAKEKRIV